MHLVISKLLSKCSVILHPNKRTLKTKVAVRERLSWLCLLSDITPDAILGTANRLGKCNDKIKLLKHYGKFLVLAHQSRRLRGELIGKESSQRPCVC